MATELGCIIAIMKAPTKKKRLPHKKRNTMDLCKLYLDRAVTYHNMFVKWYLTAL